MILHGPVAALVVSAICLAFFGFVAALWGFFTLLDYFGLSTNMQLVIIFGLLFVGLMVWGAISGVRV